MRKHFWINMIQKMIYHFNHNKSVMKQTLEEAAKQGAEGYNIVGQTIYKSGFRDGAEWQAKQSPWTSVQETPPMDIPLLLRYGNGGMYDLEVAEYSGIHYYNIQGQILDAEITHWMPIPKFNE